MSLIDIHFSSAVQSCFLLPKAAGVAVEAPRSPVMSCPSTMVFQSGDREIWPAIVARERHFANAVRCGIDRSLWSRKRFATVSAEMATNH